MFVLPVWWGEATTCTAFTTSNLDMVAILSHHLGNTNPGKNNITSCTCIFSTNTVTQLLETVQSFPPHDKRFVQVWKVTRETQNTHYSICHSVILWVMHFCYIRSLADKHVIHYGSHTQTPPHQIFTEPCYNYYPVLRCDLTWPHFLLADQKRKKTAQSNPFHHQTTTATLISVKVARFPRPDEYLSLLETKNKPNLNSRQPKPSQPKPNQAKSSQDKPSQAKRSQARNRTLIIVLLFISLFHASLLASPFYQPSFRFTAGGNQRAAQTSQDYQGLWSTWAWLRRWIAVWMVRWCGCGIERDWSESKGGLLCG